MKQFVDGQKRCHWKSGGWHCPNDAVRVADWGEGRWSRLCEHHWDLRDEMRPASRAYHKAAIHAAMLVANGEMTLDHALDFLHNGDVRP